MKNLERSPTCVSSRRWISTKGLSALVCLSSQIKEVITPQVTQKGTTSSPSRTLRKTGRDRENMTWKFETDLSACLPHTCQCCMSLNTIIKSQFCWLKLIKMSLKQPKCEHYKKIGVLPVWRILVSYKGRCSMSWIVIRRGRKVEVRRPRKGSHPYICLEQPRDCESR